MRRFKRARFTRRHIPKHWCRKTQTTALSMGSSTTIDILQPGDYDSNTALSPSGVTAARIIVEAWVSMTPGAALDFSEVQWMLCEADQDQGALTVSTQNLTDERILAMGAVSAWLPTAAGAVGVWAPSLEIHVDTKQRVRLKDSDLRMVFTEAGGDTGASVRVMSAVLLVGDAT